MKKSLLLILFLLCASFAFSQVDYNNSKDEKPQPRPDRYAARQLKWEASQKTKSATPEPLAPAAASKKLNPQDKAEKLLNTSFVPPDFPKFYGGMSDKEYEEKVAKWFAINPDKRKTNK